MNDIIINAIAMAIAYLISLAGMEYAASKGGKVKILLIILIITVFSLFGGWAIAFNENKIPIDAVEKEWKRYTIYCREEHISWNEITFPEWLSLQASE